MIRLTRLSQKASLFVLAAMTVVLIVTAHGIRASSAESSRNNTSFLRSANHALLHSDFEVSMVRAAGEAASFALTRNPTYLHGSAQAVQSAALALDRSSLVSGT